MAVRLKRVYDDPSDSDGVRILIDRLWPRGLSKKDAQVDHWLKDVAPSAELRKWFGHDPQKWTEFRTRYRAELSDNPALDELKSVVEEEGEVTLLYAAKDQEHNHAIVLKQVMDAGS